MDKNEIMRLSTMTDKEFAPIELKLNPRGKFHIENGVKNLTDLKNVLDSEKVTFWLSAGTLLGAYRDRDFIPWDDDIDIDSYEEYLIPKISEIRQKFLDLGFVVRLPKKKQGVKMNIYRYKQKVSIDGLFLDESYKNNKFRLSRSYRFPRKFYETHGTLVFKGMEFRVPTPVEDFLKHVYGNWEKPIKSYDANKYTSDDMRR